MAEKPVPIEDFAPEENDAVKKWSDNLNDFDIGHLYNALGYAPGHGGYRPKADLEPGFLDKIGQHFGVQTAKMKERADLIQKQHELKPLVSALVADKIHRIATLRAAPQNVGEAPGIDQMVGIGSGGSPNGLQPAPTLGGDPAMQGMPLGASSANAAAMPQIGPPDTALPQPLSQGGRFMTPDAAMTTPIVNQSAPQQFDEQGKPIQAPQQLGLIEQPIRPEPIASPMSRAPMPQAAPQALPEWRRHQYATALHAQATGALMPDETGRLVPSSFMAPESRLLTAPQQQELDNIYNGGKPTGAVKLPAVPYMAALKGKQDKTLQGLSAPIKDYLQAKNMEPTATNIDIARNATRSEKITDEQSSIQFKESLQAGSQRTRDFLASKHGVLFLKDASPAQIEDAIKAAADQEVSVHARNLINQFNLGGLDATEKEKLVGLQQVANVTERLKTEFTPAERREFVGYLTLPITRMAQIAKANPRFALFDAVLNREGVAAFDTAGKNLTANESAIIFGFLPQGKEWSPENFEAKLMEGDKYARTKIGDIVTLATTNRRDLAKKMEAGLPKKDAKLSAAERYNQLEKQGMKEADIYNQLVIEGHKVN